MVLLVGQWRRRLLTRLRLVLLLLVVVRRLKLWLLLLALVVQLLTPRWLRLRLRLRLRVCVWQARPPPRAVLPHLPDHWPRDPGPAGALVDGLSVHVFPLPLPFLGRDRKRFTTIVMRNGEGVHGKAEGRGWGDGLLRLKAAVASGERGCYLEGGEVVQLFLAVPSPLLLLPRAERRDFRNLREGGDKQRCMRGSGVCGGQGVKPYSGHTRDGMTQRAWWAGRVSWVSPAGP